MFRQSPHVSTTVRVRTRALLPALAALALLVMTIISLPRAQAKLAANTVDPLATISPDGRHITVTGPVSTDQA